MGIETNLGVVNNTEAVRLKVAAELKGLGISEVPKTVLDNFIVLEQHSKFNDDTRMILEGVRAVQQLEGSFALNAAERKQLDLAAYLHDVGKAGPSIDPECRLAIVKLFSVGNVKDRKKTTVGEIIKASFSGNETAAMISKLSEVGVTLDMTMLEFYDMHAHWTKDVLDKSPEIFDNNTRIIAASHHIDRGINPYGIDIKNVEKISNELKYSIFLLMAIDKYQAVVKRSEGTHEKAMEFLRTAFGQYDGDEIMGLIMKAIEQLGGSNSLFPGSVRSQDKLTTEPAK